MKRTRLAGLAVALGLACAACSDDPEPKFSPPESTSAAPTETETTSEPPEPLDPEETVRAWVEGQNKALKTGETAEVRSLSSARCRSCDDFIEPVEATYKAGGNYDTAGWKLDAVQTESKTDATAKVAVGVTFAGGTRTPEQGADPTAYSPEKHIMEFELAMEAGQWRVRLVVFVP